MTSIRHQYKSIGVSSFYKENGDSYVNPHHKAICACLNSVLSIWKPPLNNVLDLACGSGEITNNIKANNITGIDPYTQKSYFNNTGKIALSYSFEDIADGAISSHSYDVIICSFAMHLLPKSKLPNLLFALSQISSRLLILSPHKKPEINHYWNLKGESYVQRVRAKWYESI